MHEVKSYYEMVLDDPQLVFKMLPLLRTLVLIRNISLMRFIAKSL